MKAAARFFALAVVASSAVVTTQVLAEESHQGTPAKPAISPGSLSPAGLARDPLLQQQSQSDDLSSRVDQLEASRAAVDQKSKPAVSLSITGTVAKEISITH
jgi:hypothetical protein